MELGGGKSLNIVDSLQPGTTQWALGPLCGQNQTPSTPQNPSSPGLGVELSHDGSGNGDGPFSKTPLNTQKKLHSSGCPPSLTWDSDSEKETLDEEELLYLSNPHGLAAHSPGPPTCGHEQKRLQSEICQAHEKSFPLHKDLPMKGWDEGNIGTHQEDPSPQQAEDNSVGDVRNQAGLLLLDMEPKGGCKRNEEEEVKESKQKEKTSSLKQDVYNFPDDSDTEGPPPAPWAHCTFIQHRKKKRALLRRFSGLGTWQSSTAGINRKGKDRGPPSRAQQSRSIHSDPVRVFEFKEKQEHEEVQEGDKEQETRVDLNPEIFTCVECSIYFRKRAHLWQHMQEHSKSSGSGSRATHGKEGLLGKQTSWNDLECIECGQEVGDRFPLTDHHICHHQSPSKILEETGKLNEAGEGPVEQSTKSTGKEIAGLTPACGQFMCLKCNFSSDIPQELAYHAKVHTVYTCHQCTSPRLRPKRCQTEYLKSSGESSSRLLTSLPHSPKPSVQMSSERYISDEQSAFCSSDVHVSKKEEEELEFSPECSHNHLMSTGSTELSDRSSLVAPQTSTVLRLDSIHNDGLPSTEAMIVEENSLLPQSSVGKAQSAKGKPRRKYVAFKSTGIRRSSRVAKERKKQENQSSETSDILDHTPKTDHLADKKPKEVKSPLVPKLGSTTDPVEVPVQALQVKHSFSPSMWVATERLGLTEGQQAQIRHTLPIVVINSLSSGIPVNSTVLVDLFSGKAPDSRASCSPKEENVNPEEPKDPNISCNIKNRADNANNEEDKDMVRCLFKEDVSSEEEETELSKSAERKCPYCADHFHNGIGLANHVRGHLNRVGVSYNVRHFISPEEVNAIEKKFSLQKKRKKVANFDLSTFSVMRCEFCSAGFDTRAGLSSHARAHLRDFGITNWEVTVSPINILRKLFSSRPDIVLPKTSPQTSPLGQVQAPGEEVDLGTSETNSDEMGVWQTLSHTQESATQAWTEDQKDALSECGEENATQVLPLENFTFGLEGTMESSAVAVGISTKASLKESFHMASSLREDEELEEKPLATALKVARSPTVPSPAGSLSPSPILSSHSPSPVLRMAPISSLLPASSPLRSLDNKDVGKSPSLSPPSKPFWVPLESNAQLNLKVDHKKDLSCQLCGAWFETRKGLSSHARAHLRHFGVEYSESKGSPIELLNRLILTEDFKYRASSLFPEAPVDLGGHTVGRTPPLPSSSSQRLVPSNTYNASCLGGRNATKATSSFASPLQGPPSKRFRTPHLKVFRLTGVKVTPFSKAEPVKEVGCEFCGEFFENRKGLSSHARSHLRQLGVTEWSVNGSPIDTLQEVISQRGLTCVVPLKHTKSARASLSSAPAQSTVLPPSSPGDLLGCLSLPFSQNPNHQLPTPHNITVPMSATCSPTAGMVNPKLEPVQVDVNLTQRAVEIDAGDSSDDPVRHSWRKSDHMQLINLAIPQDTEGKCDINCEFCGEYFENRKGLSSHARSHLRQMGITAWPVNGSPIDTLREVMREQGVTRSSVSLAVKKEAGQSNPQLQGLGYNVSKFSQKSSPDQLHSTSRLPKHGLGALRLTATPTVGTLSSVALVGEKPLSEKGNVGERLPSTKPKTFLPPAYDFSYRGKLPPEKHGIGHTDASCELCGFYFENRKALASHARAHLRQFGVTEWCVNGSPIETLSAWMHSQPRKVAEMHQSYLQGAHTVIKKKCSSPLSPSCDSNLTFSISQKLFPKQWASKHSARSSSRMTEGKPGTSPHCAGLHYNGTPAYGQIARSELNVRLPRGIERRPLKHPSLSDGGQTESGQEKSLRSSTIPALVPKPPITPLVKLVGKICSLKCRFCDTEFHGPLPVQEDWIRHLQQHILNLNCNITTAPSANTTVKYETPSLLTPNSAAMSTSTATTPILLPSPNATSTTTSACTSTPAVASAVISTESPKRAHPSTWLITNMQ